MIEVCCKCSCRTWIRLYSVYTKRLRPGDFLMETLWHGRIDRFFETTPNVCKSKRLQWNAVVCLIDGYLIQLVQHTRYCNVPIFNKQFASITTSTDYSHNIRFCLSIGPPRQRKLYLFISPYLSPYNNADTINKCVLHRARIRRPFTWLTRSPKCRFIFLYEPTA